MEIRLKLTEVAGGGGGILMGTDTHLPQAVLRHICSTPYLLFVSLQFPICKRVLRATW